MMTATAVSDMIAAGFVIKATLDDIRAGQVVISVHGDHVPPGVQAKPPPLNGPKPIPAVLRNLRQQCIEG
eukprot:3427313-Prymnesium_polylepis.1